MRFCCVGFARRLRWWLARRASVAARTAASVVARTAASVAATAAARRRPPLEDHGLDCRPMISFLLCPCCGQRDPAQVANLRRPSRRRSGWADVRDENLKGM